MPQNFLEVVFLFQVEFGGIDILIIYIRMFVDQFYEL